MPILKISSEISISTKNICVKNGSSISITQGKKSILEGMHFDVSLELHKIK